MLRPLPVIGRPAFGRPMIRLTVIGLSLALITGCGSGETAGAAGETSPAASARGSARAVGAEEARTAFEVLAELDDAWRKRDCTKVAFLTTWAERVLSGAACEATREGRSAPGSFDYREAEFYLPVEDGLWFLAMAREPDPAYFLFHKQEGRWCLAAGPLGINGRFPALTAGAPIGVLPTDAAAAGAEEAEEAVSAGLVPQRHLAYLTDPVGVNNISFPGGDPVEELHDELVRKPAGVRPDRLGVDVRLVDVPIRALRLDDGTALVFHALEITFDQKSDRRLAHPIYGADDLKPFTGTTRPRSLAGTETVFLATRVDRAGKMRTIAMNRVLSNLTAKNP